MTAIELQHNVLLPGFSLLACFPCCHLIHAALELPCRCNLSSDDQQRRGTGRASSKGPHKALEAAQRVSRVHSRRRQGLVSKRYSKRHNPAATLPPIQPSHFCLPATYHRRRHLRDSRRAPALTCLHKDILVPIFGLRTLSWRLCMASSVLQVLV